MNKNERLGLALLFIVIIVSILGLTYYFNHHKSHALTQTITAPPLQAPAPLP
jgi:hypothetical protein